MNHFVSARYQEVFVACSYPWTRLSNTQRRFIQESYLRWNVSGLPVRFLETAYMSQYYVTSAVEMMSLKKQKMKSDLSI
jgi:hypothetical protein